MGNAEIYKIVNANALTKLVYKSALGKCEIFALVVGGCDLVREVSYVYFPNNSIAVGLNAGCKVILAPTLGVRARKIYYHAAVTV